MMRTLWRSLVLVLMLSSCLPSTFAQVQTGTPPFGSFAGGPDTINLANLNAHIQIPVLHKTGRGTNFTYDLAYDSSVWYPVSSGSSQVWTPVPNWGWSVLTEAFTGYLSYSETYQSACNGQGTLYSSSNWTYHDTFGVSHVWSGYTSNWFVGSPQCTGYNTGFNAPAPDGSGYTLDVNGGSVVGLYARNGTVIVAPINTQSGAGKYTDRNGNELTVNSSGQFFDTLNSTVAALTVSGSGSSTSPMVYSYSPPGSSPHCSATNASFACYTMNYTNYTVATNFGVSGVSEYKSSAAVPLVSSVVLPDGSEYEFQYEATPGSCTPYSGTSCVTGQVTQITLPTGGTISYAYSGGHNGIWSDGSAATLTRTLNPGGIWKYAQVKDTAPATTTTVTDPANNVTTIQFQGIYETQRVVNEGSSTVLLTKNTCYTPATPCTGTAVTLPITELNITNILPGSNNLTDNHTFGYDDYGDLLSEQDWDYGSGAPGSPLAKTVITYASLGDIVGFPATVTVSNGGGTTFAATTYSYDQTAVQPTTNTPQHVSVTGSRGNLTTINQSTSSNTSLTQTYTYFDTGNVQTFTDVNGAQTTYTYGTCGNSFLTAVSEPLSLSRSYTWDSACAGGVIESIKDENSRTTTIAYTDSYYWRPASVTDPTNATVNYCYHLVSSGPCGTLSTAQVETYLSNFTSNTTTVNVDSLTTVDGLGRTILQQTRQQAGGSEFDTVETDYDALGRVAKVSVPFQSAAGTTNSGAYGTTYSYDALNRPSGQADSDGLSATILYPQNDTNISITAPSGENNKVRQLQYNSIGLLTSVCEVTAGTSAWPGGSCAQNNAQTGYLTTYAYNPLGEITGVTQNAQSASKQQTRAYVYDWLGRLTSETNPESGTTNYWYDNNPPSICANTASGGDLTGKQDAAGHPYCPYHDALHRLTAIGTDSTCTHFAYDSASHGVLGSAPSGVTISNALGRLIEAETDTCTSPITQSAILTDAWFSYTTRGQISNAWESTPHSGIYYPLGATYWPSGAPQTLTGQAGWGLFYYLDPEGRVYSTSAGTEALNSTNYNPSSQVTQLNYWSGDTDNFTYDNMGRMKTYQYTVNSQTETGTLSWNGDGTLASLVITDPFNSANTQNCGYSHDDLVRVASASCTSNPAMSQTFEYDPFGNLTQSGSFSFLPTYSYQTNHMTAIGSNTPTYDADGNVTNDFSNTYTSWDAYGHPTQINGIGVTYDALGRIVERKNGSTYTQVIYAVTGAKIEIANGQSVIQNFVPLPGGAMTMSTTTGPYYRHPDWLGSSRLTSTTSRTVYYDGAYSPFGSPYSQSGTTDLDFTGMNQDTSANVYDFPAREYAPNGRWPSPDPAGMAAVDPTNPQSWNRYAYVLNNPLAAIDPLGLDDCVILSDSGGESVINTSSEEACENLGGIYNPGINTAPNPIVTNVDINGLTTDPAYDGANGASLNFGGPTLLTMGLGGLTTLDKSPYSRTMSCSLNASQVMDTVENNFTLFGNYSRWEGFESVEFFPPSEMVPGSTIPISVGVAGASLNLSVTVQSINSQNMTFTTNPGHLIYPGSITFAASPASPGSINFSIAIQGTIAQPFQFYFGGSSFEDAQWNHFIGLVGELCKAGG